MKFVQINTHKAQLAAIELHNELERVKEVALITEPYTYKNKIVGLPAGYEAFCGHGGEDGPPARAAILLPRSIPAVKLDQFCSRDSVILVIDTLSGKLIIGSIYLDIHLEVLQPWFERLLEHAENEGRRLLLGVDTNAHSQLFGPFFCGERAHS